MSSALHPPHTTSATSSHQSTKQWWSRPSASKSATVSAFRNSDSSSGLSTPTTPTSGATQMYDDKSLKGSKQSRKFNTLASVIGFKSKKSHPTINIPSGPVSPPLPVQNPPPSQSATSLRDKPPRPPRSARPVTASSSSSYQYDPKSPGEPSIYTYPSSEEGTHEPITPSDQLSRHRTSYQPSLFTFAEQQDQSVAALRLGDPSRSPYSPSSDTRRISVLSDPSVIDPHMMKREQAIRSSRVSASSYYPAHHSEQKHLSGSGKLSAGFLHHRDSLEKRKSSGDSLYSKEIDLTSDTDTHATHRKSPELRTRDLRHSDIPVPAMPKLSASMLLTSQRASLQKPTSENVVASKSLSGSRSVSRTGSPVSTANGHSTVHEEERSGRDRVASLRNSDSPAHEHSPRLTPALIRPKAASVSAGSLTGGSNAGGRPSPSIVTSFASATPLSRNASVTSGTGSVANPKSTGVVQRQQSLSRMRAVPPSRNPPPSSNLPPTPQDRPPSPLTFRSPKNLSSSSLLNSAHSASDDPSILTFDLPPSTPSSEASSGSLCFAQPPTTQGSMLSDLDPNSVSTFPRSHHRDVRSTNAGRLYRPETATQTSGTFGSHTAKSSFSSGHTLMSAFATRGGDTPIQRSIRKSMSQSSITAIINGRGDRQRVDSDASGVAGNYPGQDEHPMTVLNSMKSLRKQRSFHASRAPGGSLALPPLPQQLRHASSFNNSSVSEASASGHSSHTKGDSLTSPSGSQRRGANSSTPASTAANSHVNTPTTPQTHKKRSLFSSHGRDRERDKRDSNLEREKHDSANISLSPDVHHVEKKKSHSIGLGLFSGHFSPSSSSSQIPELSSTASIQEYRPASPTVETASIPSTNAPPSNAGDHLDQHILPPKELLSQMEALADENPPSSPPQYSDRGLDDETDESYWEGSSLIDQRSTRSRLNSLSGHSIASSTDENGAIVNGSARSSSLSLTTRHFANASGSIHGRLESGDRPSSSRLPIRNVSGMSARSRPSTTRPATADSFARDLSSNSSNGDSCAPIGLPPPPRRKRAIISSPMTDHVESDEPEISPLPPPPPRSNTAGSGRLQRLLSVESQRQGQGRGLERLSSYETISTYNPNRVSIFRKPSFLNIEDEMSEQTNGDEDITDSNEGGSGAGALMVTVPEDSFLILEHGKDSLDLSRTPDDAYGPS